MDLALDNLQRFICPKTKQTKPVDLILILSLPHQSLSIHTKMYIYIYTLGKNKTGHIRIMNLFPSCYVFLI